MDRLAGLLGVLGVMVGVGFPVYFGLLDPGYDPARHFISELGDATAPNAWAVNWLGFMPAGLLQTGFAVLAWMVLPRAWMLSIAMLGVLSFAGGSVGAAVFPCDTGCTATSPSFSEFMHFLVVLPGYLLAPVSTLLIGLSARHWPGGGWISPIGFICTVGALAGFAAMLNAFETEFPGLWQRLLETSFQVTVLAVSCYLLLRPRPE